MVDSDNIQHHGPLSIDRTTDEFGQTRYFIHDDLTGDWLGESFDTKEAASAEIAYLQGRAS